MIVPGGRLPALAAAVAIPAMTWAFLEPAEASIPMAVMGGFAAVALADALLAKKSLARVEAKAPETVRLARNREGVVPVSFHVHGKPPRPFRAGLAPPPAFESLDEVRAFLPGRPGEVLEMPWRCRPLRRGRYLLEWCFLEASSPLKLWRWRTRRPLKTELRVYPDLLGERKTLSAFFLDRRGWGIHPRPLVGKGREFENLRDYVPGDGMEDVHWKATARRGHPVTKVFRTERTREVYVVVDASRSSLRPVPLSPASSWKTDGDRPLPSREPLVERFVTAALALGLAAERQGDRFGLAAFSDRLEHFSRASRGRGHYNHCREVLATLEARPVAPDFDEPCSFLASRLKRRALLVFLTTLDDPVLAEGFLKSLEALRRRHLVQAIMLRPPSARPLFSDDAVATADDVYGRLAGHFSWASLRELEQRFRRRGASLALADHETLCLQLISRYMAVKQRQLL